MEQLHLVAFCKAMKHPTRRKILKILATGPKPGRLVYGFLSEKDPSVVFHHLRILIELNLIQLFRKDNVVYFELNTPLLNEYIDALPKDTLLTGQKKEEARFDQDEQAILQAYFTEDCKLTQLPSSLNEKLVILAYLVSGFEQGKIYKLSDVEQCLRPYYEDTYFLIAQLICNRFFYHDNGTIEVNPREMWKKPEQIQQ